MKTGLIKCKKPICCLLLSFLNFNLYLSIYVIKSNYLLKYIFFNILLFSMFKIIKQETMIGSDWNLIRLAQSGSENVGIFITYLSMNLM